MDGWMDPLNLYELLHTLSPLPPVPGALLHPGPAFAALHGLSQQPGPSRHGHLHGELAVHDEDLAGTLRIHRQAAGDARVSGYRRPPSP